MAIEAYSALPLTLIAAADLSALQFTFVKLNATGGVVAVAAATDIPIGVLQNKPTSGQAATIVSLGLSKIKASAALVTGNLLGTTASGTGVAIVAGTDTTKYILGQVFVAAGAANRYASALINCVAPSRAA